MQSAAASCRAMDLLCFEERNRKLPLRQTSGNYSAPVPMCYVLVPKRPSVIKVVDKPRTPYKTPSCPHACRVEDPQRLKARFTGFAAVSDEGGPVRTEFPCSMPTDTISVGQFAKT